MIRKMCLMLTVLMIVQVGFCRVVDLCGSETADKDVIDLRIDTVEVKSLGASVSTDDGLRVTFVKDDCGVMVTVPQGKRDLSKYAAVAIDVRNVGAVPVTLIGELNGIDWSNSFLHVPAGQKGTMIIYLMRKELSDDRSKQFTGMRGVPGGYIWHWVGIDAGNIKTITIRDLNGVSTGGKIQVESIRSIGKYGELSDEQAKIYFPFVDRFGQFKHRSWQGKVESADDLKKHRNNETADLRKHNGAVGWSKYGGWVDGPKLNATGHFRVEKYKGKWWFVDPEGYLFFSHGIDCVRFSANTTLWKREGYFEELPDGYYNGKGVDFAGANQHVKYGDGWEESVIDLAHRRLKSWGMNTVGNWSDPKAYMAGGTPYVVAVHYGWDKAKLADLIKEPEKLRMLLRKRLEQEKGKTSDDPWCIGYFVDNEISWRKGMDAEVYYKVVSEEVKRIAPKKLYMGSRLHGHDEPYGSRERLVRAAAKYCDVIGVNRYRFSPSDLRMPDGVDKPLIIGEFHFGALDRGMIHPGLRGISNQQQRGYAYEHYLTEALKHPHIVGTHWFQYREQNITGRGDGENYQIGFVDICDTPYQEIIDASRRVGYRMYEIRSGL